MLVNHLKNENTTAEDESCVFQDLLTSRMTLLDKDFHSSHEKDSSNQHMGVKSPRMLQRVERYVRKHMLGSSHQAFDFIFSAELKSARLQLNKNNYICFIKKLSFSVRKEWD